MLAAALAVALGAGCQSGPPAELVPFTNEIRLRYQLEDAELRKLQFYLSDRIVLERVADKAPGQVKRGRLIVRSGTVIHQVLVRRGTPGVIERRGEIRDERNVHTIDVSFKPGAPLRFSASQAGGKYALVDPLAQGSFARFLASFGQRRQLIVDFAGARWPVVEGSKAVLLIEKSALGKLRRSRRVLPGVKVPRR